ncbi:NAD(P)-binding domain-containing protein [Leptolyngbya sp. FACHB-541]|uniref:NADPH-dependent F420 reductase n=1 Tax=Leptolyngbya sp. FACHB-541 TaxID=2692810 RepID=UPI00168505A2|nr:NAD(P)-binding domain-containing protein [Leptolyngbya sp. FACHB-541]MBD1996487.1 NAD(P)-binding domain-containing protein [Leptolyngbya sp. FACHB-541]
MNIGIIGAGNIGATLAELLTRAGHAIAISNSRGPESLQELVTQLGPNAHAATVTEAATFGEIVIEAIPFGRYADLPAETLKSKILVNAGNYYPDRDGVIDLQGLTHSEFIASHLPAVKVIKAFNTIYWVHLREQGDLTKPLEERRAIFIAGDDAEAKQTVSKLIEAIGFAPVDTGSLHNSRIQEPGADIYNKTLTAREANSLIPNS